MSRVKRALDARGIRALPTAAILTAVILTAAMSLGLVGPVRAQSASAQTDPVAALEAGNRLFEAGRFDEAVEAYRAGWDPRRPHPTLAYNLATALHHQDRLPEAILWYKRVITEDPWAEENLLLARRSLGSPRLPLGGTRGWLRAHAPGLGLAAIAAAWTALGLVGFGIRRGGLIVGAVALGLYACLVVVDARGPRAAVLLEECSAVAGRLPPGTEAWVRPKDGGFQVLGADGLECPSEIVALVRSHGGDSHRGDAP